MKRILLFTESIGAGGAERQLTGLAVELNNKGYCVKLVTYFRNQFYEKYLIENGVDYLLIENATNIIKRIYYVNKVIKSFNPDTIISYLPAPNKLMCLLKPLHNYKLIVSERNTTMHWGMQEYILFNLYRLSDYIIPNSYNEGENIISHKPFLKKKIVTITNFVDTDYFVPKQHDPNNIPVIICVGRITEQKNVLRFLEAIKILKSRGLLFKVKWFGSHSYVDYCDKVYEKTKDLDISDVIKFYQPSENILQEYQMVDIFCLPSIHEGYPNVLCEAMSCGLPVVCSNTCENPRIVSEGIHGFLFDPYSVDCMANAIERMLAFSVEEKMIMGNACRYKTVENNSVESFTEKYIRII